MKKLLVVAFFLSLIACKKETVTGPPGPKGDPGAAVPSGNIVGRVTQFKEDQTKYTSGLNTTTVSIEGQNKSTVTDAGGNYTLASVPPGVYTLVFEKSGAGTIKQQQVSHPGNGNLIINATLNDRPTWVLTSMLIKDSTVNTTHSLFVQLGHPQKTGPIAATIYFSRDANIDPQNPATFDYSTGYYLSTNSTLTALPLLPYTPLYEAGYVSGTIYFVQVFPINPNASYMDYATNTAVFAATGTPMPGQALIIP